MAITASDFRAAFVSEWQRIDQEHPYEITDAYENDTAWSEFMLSSNGFLKKVMESISGQKQLKLSFHRGWHDCDCVYLSGDEYTGDDSDSSRPESRTEVAVMHENIFSNIGPEMEKLIHIRSPLKVLITYAPYQADKGVNKNLLAIRNMLTDTWKCVDGSSHLIDEDSEFLIIIGDREKKTDKTSDIKWSWVGKGVVNSDPLR
jgi:hypothetical protein